METRKAALRVGTICLKVALFLLICLSIAYLGRTAYRYTRAVFQNEAMEAGPGKNVRIRIEEAVTIREFAEVLEENGLIENAEVFLIQMKLAGYEQEIEAGSYLLNTSMTPSEILDALSAADGDET